MFSEIEKSPSIKLSQQLLAEAFGTFMLVFSVGVTQGNALSVAPALWAAMIATGFVSGAQFNPAVSIAVSVNAILSRSLDLKYRLFLSALYIPLQLLFGLFGAYAAYIVIDSTIIEITYFDVSIGTKVSQAFVGELFFTTVLTTCAVIGGNFTKSNILVGGAVAVTVSAGDFAVGSYSGGCFNPAVGFGTNMIYYAIKGNTTHRVWLYLVAPGLGGVLGGCFATFFSSFKKDLHEMRKTYY